MDDEADSDEDVPNLQVQHPEISASEIFDRPAGQFDMSLGKGPVAGMSGGGFGVANHQQMPTIDEDGFETVQRRRR